MVTLLADNKKHLKNIIIISIAFLLTNGFILVLTGTWWDEKTWAFASAARRWDVSLQLGRPIDFFLQSFIFEIPEVLARIVIFLCFYFITLGAYCIYNQIPFLDANSAFLMTLIFIAIPANDARVMRGIFPYTAGYCFFMIAFCTLILLQKKYEYKNIPLRIATLVLFLCSFSLNSDLVFYGIPCLYILWYILINRKIRKFYKWLDFVVAPLIFFGIKVVFFPAHGIYEDYNKVTVRRIAFGIIRTVKVCIGRLIDMAGNWTNYKVLAVLFIGAVLLLIGLVYERKSTKLDALFPSRPYELSLKYRIILLFMGGIIMYLGAFAYVVIGQNCSLTGVGGRSSILLPLGAAILIYAVTLWVPGKCVGSILCCTISLCGFLHFNSYYLSYQQDYYRQQDLIYELKENSELLSETKNVLYLSSFEPKVGATRFYSLNSLGREAFGDESHFIMNGIRDYFRLTDDTAHKINIDSYVNQGDYQMKDYEIGRSTDIEAIIVYENDLSEWESLWLKIKELFNHKAFEDELYGETNLTVYTPDMEEFNEVLTQQGYSFGYCKSG